MYPTTKTHRSSRPIGSAIALLAALTAGLWAWSSSPAKAEWLGPCGIAPDGGASWPPGFCFPSMDAACQAYGEVFSPIIYIRLFPDSLIKASCYFHWGPIIQSQPTFPACEAGSEFTFWRPNGCMTPIPGEALGVPDPDKCEGNQPAHAV